MSEALNEIFLKMVEFQKNHIWPILFMMRIITGFFLFHALRLEVDPTMDFALESKDDFQRKKSQGQTWIVNKINFNIRKYTDN